MKSSYDSAQVAIHAESQALQKRQAREANELALAEFYARGGQVQKIDPFVSGVAAGETFSAWGAKKKKKGEEPTLTPEEDLL